MDYVGLAEATNGPIPRNVDFSYVSGAALEELAHRQPDARVINLETSITRNAAYDPKGINYRVSPENAVCLAAAGIDCCVLANNHMRDWGPDGLFDTLATLEHLRMSSVLAPAGTLRRRALQPFWRSRAKGACSCSRSLPRRVGSRAIGQPERIVPG